MVTAYLKVRWSVQAGHGYCLSEESMIPEPTLLLTANICLPVEDGQ